MSFFTGLKALKLSLGNHAFWTNSQPSRRRRRYSHIGFIEQLEHRTLLSSAPVDDPDVEDDPATTSAPVITAEQFDVPENDPSTIMALIAISDPEADASITGGDPNNLFWINEFHEIETESDFDYESGEITFELEVTATNEYGSDTATIVINITDVDEEPVLVSFTARKSVGDVWIFEGTVEDEALSSGNVVVYLTGLINVTVQVNSDGTFSHSQILTGTGFVTAQADDGLYLSLEELEVFI